jgi:putative transposase
MKGITELHRRRVPVAEACTALAIPRGSYYRSRRPAVPRRRRERPRSHRALAEGERQRVLAALHSPRFVDRSPPAVVATLLEEDTYLCSPRTMYRILDDQKEVRERRTQLRRPHYAKPELLATAPNQVWTWDLTKLRGPEKWTYYTLYVVLDLYSRLVVAWMLAHRESGSLARELFAQAYDQQRIEPGHLVVHSDRGSAPTAKTLAQLHADLGVAVSLSRPRVSNDNPFSEAHFKTLKYAPGFPDRFGSYPDAHGWCQHFFPWYNGEHRHSALAHLTPMQVHYGQADGVLARRREVLEAARASHPERFVHGAPRVASLPEAVWINPPEDRSRVDQGLANARKVPLPGLTTSCAAQRSESRIAGGDERSELVLDADRCGAHPQPLTQEDLR